MKVTGTGISGEVTVVKINSQTDIVLSSAVTITDETALTFAFDGAVLGSAGGENTHLLTSSESGQVAHTHTADQPAHNHSVPMVDETGGSTAGIYGAAYITNGNTAAPAAPTSSADPTITVSTVDAADASSAHNIIQPTLVLNYIIKT